MAATTDERQAKLERFVALDALATFLANLGSTAAAPASDNGGRPLTAIPELDRALEEAMNRLSGDLFDELWPGESYEGSPEWDDASSRARQLAAAMFMAVADDPAYCCRAAGRFLELADPH